ncbi:MAG: hypothetical protein ACF8LK_05510, partial [Phycisphaerales bacterium JB041]
MTDEPAKRGELMGPYSAPQLRLDTWNDLQLRSSWLHEFAREKRDITEPRALVAQSLDQLRVLESYWAFPGAALVDRLSGLLESGEFPKLRAETSEIARLLVGDAYRRRDTSYEDRHSGLQTTGSRH